MIAPKSIGIAAVVGFVFSFLVGLFSGISFGHILLRALISAGICGVLGAGISFLFQRFLSDSADSGFDTSSSGGEGSRGSGGLVDITIDDDALADDSQEPRFAVDNAHAIVTPAAEKKQEPEEPAAAGSVSERTVSADPAEPVPDDEDEPARPVASDSASSAASSEPAFQPIPLAQAAPKPPVASGVQPAKAGGADLDELPDIGDFGSPASGAQPSEVIRDSDFATGGSEPPVSLASTGSAKGGVAVEQNASVMAQAIQTILAKEN
ncbi:MAG: hypothetical protein K6G80_05765 [Treponema sp.]|nr:hypothetical protein [Treponema sp.]